MKLDGCFHNMKWNESLAKKARKLIFSEKKYVNFSCEEKRIVDSYQEKLLKVDGGAILPNTGADLVQMKIEQLIAEQRHNNE